MNAVKIRQGVELIEKQICTSGNVRTWTHLKSGNCVRKIGLPLQQVKLQCVYVYNLEPAIIT